MEPKLLRFLEDARRIVQRTAESYPWTVGKKAAFEIVSLDVNARNTDAIAIPQFAVVCHDITNPGGVVQFGSANAGPILGVNQSKGIDATTGAVTAAVQIGQSLEVRIQGVSRVVASAATVIGQPVTGTGVLGLVVAGVGLGFALEAAAVSGDVIPVLLKPGEAVALKQLGTVAAPLTANAGANTQSSHAHGLGYIPSVVIIVGVQGVSGPVNLSAAADATNIFEKSPVASATFIAYVA